MAGVRVMRGLSVAVGGVVFALLVSACGGGTSKAASTASSTPAVSPSVSTAPSSGGANPNARGTANFAAYTACLAQHGVTVPSFSPGARPSGSFSRPPGGFSRPPGASRGPGGGGGFGGFGGSADPSTAAARAACASLLPTGAFGGGRTISATTFAAFKSCMSDNGVTITVTVPTQAVRSLNRSDAKTAAALKICQPILGTGAAGSGAQTPSGPAPAATS